MLFQSPRYHNCIVMDISAGVVAADASSEALTSGLLPQHNISPSPGLPGAPSFMVSQYPWTLFQTLCPKCLPRCTKVEPPSPATRFHPSKESPEHPATTMHISWASSQMTWLQSIFQMDQTQSYFLTSTFCLFLGSFRGIHGP